MKINLTENWETDFDEQSTMEYPTLMSETFGYAISSTSPAEQLRKELCMNHPLLESEFTLFAVPKDNPNEFIFSTSDERYPLIFVHLTWNEQKEEGFPRIEKVEIA